MPISSSTCRRLYTEPPSSYARQLFCCCTSTAKKKPTTTSSVGQSAIRVAQYKKIYIVGAQWNIQPVWSEINI